MSSEKGTDNVVHTDAEDFVCSNCGGVMRFDIVSQKFMCSSCREEKDVGAAEDSIKEFDFGGYRQREQESQPFDGMAVCTCRNCGLEITFESRQVAAVCPMCSSSQFVEAKQKAGIAPDGIIPFKIDKNEAQRMFREWVKSRWFAPKDFKTRFGEGNLAGMYLPFWTYDASVMSSYTGKGGIERKAKDEKGNEVTKTDWYNVSGVVSSKFDDVLICASEKEENIRGILPYKTTSASLKPYSPSYLSGYYAEIYKLKADKCFEAAKAIMDGQMRVKAASDIRRKYDKAQITTLKSTHHNVTYKHVLLPLWSSAYSYNGQIYGYLINGETGCVSGDRPYSKFKIALLVAAVIIIISAIIGVAAVNAGTTDALYERSYLTASTEYNYSKSLSQ